MRVPLAVALLLLAGCSQAPAADPAEAVEPAPTSGPLPEDVPLEEAGDLAAP